MIDIKPCKPENLASLKYLRRRMLAEGYGIKSDSPDADQLFANTDKYLEEGDYEAVVALDGEQVVGCASICYQSLIPVPVYPNGLRGYIQYVYVLPDYRKKGICRQMLERILEQASAKGAREILLDTTEMGRSIYEKLGFIQDKDTMIYLTRSNSRK